MYEPRNHSDHFDISATGILFSATEDDIADPNKTASSSIYHIPLSALSAASVDMPAQIPLQVDGDTQSSHHQGWCSHLRFSPDQSTIAFIRAPMRTLLNPSIWIKSATSQSAVDMFATITRASWNLIHCGFKFAPNSQSIYFDAQDFGRVSLYALDLRTKAMPISIVCGGSVSSCHVLCKNKDGTVKLLVTISSLVDPWICQIVKASGGAGLEPQVLSNLSQDTNIGLSRRQISEIYFKGAGDYGVHAWVIKPSDFDLNKKIPIMCSRTWGPLRRMERCLEYKSMLSLCTCPETNSLTANSGTQPSGQSKDILSSLQTSREARDVDLKWPQVIGPRVQQKSIH